MANEQNLRPFDTLCRETAEKIRSNGGKAKAKKIQEQKSLRSAMRAILNGKYEHNGEILNGYEVATTQLFKALKDPDKITAAFNSIRDLIGEKPVDKIEHSGDLDVNVNASEIESRLFKPDKK